MRQELNYSCTLHPSLFSGPRLWRSKNSSPPGDMENRARMCRHFFIINDEFAAG
jgi:hypothetical protein